MFTDQCFVMFVFVVFFIVIVLSFSNCVGGHVLSFSVILEAGVISDSFLNRALFPK